MQATTTTERFNQLENSGLLEVIKNLPEAKFLDQIENGDCTTATHISRKYNTHSLWENPSNEYKAVLALECLFGAKSPIPFEANHYADRFHHVVNIM